MFSDFLFCSAIYLYVVLLIPLPFCEDESSIVPSRCYTCLIKEVSANFAVSFRRMIFRQLPLTFFFIIISAYDCFRLC